jgi:hypothetical protein
MDKIEELKKLLWILDSKHNVSVSQTKENIDYIADEIVKLFCQPAVMPSCEGNCGMNYCDDNGCIERKRILVEPTDLPEHVA